MSSTIDESKRPQIEENDLDDSNQEANLTQDWFIQTNEIMKRDKEKVKVDLITSMALSYNYVYLAAPDAAKGIHESSKERQRDEMDINLDFAARSNTRVKPLINGKETYRELYEAIDNAKHTIDIIAWDFDPTLRLLGPDDPLTLGELLLNKPFSVKVRILVWKNHQSTVVEYASEAIKDTLDPSDALKKDAKNILLDPENVGKGIAGHIEDLTNPKSLGTNIMKNLVPSPDDLHEMSLQKDIAVGATNPPKRDLSNAYKQYLRLHSSGVEIVTSSVEGQKVIHRLGKKETTATRSAIREFERTVYNYKDQRPFYYDGIESRLVKENSLADLNANILFYKSIGDAIYGYTEDIPKSNPFRTEYSNIALRRRSIDTDPVVMSKYVYKLIGGSITYLASRIPFVGGAFSYGSMYVFSKDERLDNASRISIENQAVLKKFDPSLSDEAERKSKESTTEKAGSLSQRSRDHQTMVLVDYAHIQRSDGNLEAVGFILNSGLSKTTYDNNNHHFISNDRWKGYRPSQSIGLRVRGDICHDLNDYFAKSWNESLLENKWHEWREDLDSIFGSPREGGVNRRDQPAILPSKKEDDYYAQAQVVRTDPIEKEQIILTQYLRAIGNAKEFIYFEMEDFSYEAIAQYIKIRSKKREDKSKPLYTFVVTNNDPVMGAYTATHQLMEALDYDQALSSYSRDLSETMLDIRRQLDEPLPRVEPGPMQRGLEENNQAKIRNTNLRKDYKELKRRYPNLVPWSLEEFESMDIQEIGNIHGKDSSVFDPYFEERSADEVVSRKDVFKRGEKEVKGLPEDAVADLEIVIATLKTDVPYKKRANPMEDEEGDYYYCTDIDVQSKLLLVDDTFISVGSANASMRSLKGDIELNIGAVNYSMAKKLRQELWKMHTAPRRYVVGDDNKDKDENEEALLEGFIPEEYTDWLDLMDLNWEKVQRKYSLEASIVHYYNPYMKDGELTDRE